MGSSRTLAILIDNWCCLGTVHKQPGYVCSPALLTERQRSLLSCHLHWWLHLLWTSDYAVLWVYFIWQQIHLVTYQLYMSSVKGLTFIQKIIVFSFIVLGYVFLISLCKLMIDSSSLFTSGLYYDSCKDSFLASFLPLVLSLFSLLKHMWQW